MSTSANVAIISFEAAADLTAKQYYCAKLDSAGKADVQTTAGGPVIGAIMENAKSTAGHAVGIAQGSKVQFIAGGVIAPGGKCASDNAGKLVAAVALDAIVGYYEGAANSASGDLITVVKAQSEGAGGAVS